MSDLHAKLDKSALGPKRRTAYTPVVEDGDPTSRRASKMGGTAWLNPQEPWPVCPNCKKAMALALQLDLDALPEPLRARYGNGILQFFNCTSSAPLCEVDTEAYFSGSTKAGAPRSKLLRVIEPRGDGGTATAPEENAIDAKALKAWTATPDFPSSAEAGYELFQAVEAEVGQEIYDGCASADKLGGWPKWIQDVEYPACPECSEPMSQFVYQIASDGVTNVTFCGDGVAYVCQCPTHKHRVDECAQQ